MPEKQTPKHKWISDAAYFNSINNQSKPNQEIKDWLSAEQQYYQLISNRVKSGLVRID